MEKAAWGEKDERQVAGDSQVAAELGRACVRRVSTGEGETTESMDEIKQKGNTINT
jgi:hypothetical protein